MRYESATAHDCWALSRTGETILWGVGNLAVQWDRVDDAESYELHSTEMTSLFDGPDGVGQADSTPEFGMWAIVRSVPAEESLHLLGTRNVVGHATGCVCRKMVPAVSPDITAVRLTDHPSDELEPEGF